MKGTRNLERINSMEDGSEMTENKLVRSRFQKILINSDITEQLRSNKKGILPNDRIYGFMNGIDCRVFFFQIKKTLRKD